MKLSRVLLLLAVLWSSHSIARADFINGTFSTGDLTGWTPYTTTNGTFGPAGFPNVTSFDTSGSGASLAARFQVGQVVFQSGVPAGGGIQQLLAVAAGTYNITANFAAFDADAIGNASAGIFSILIDGVTQVTTNLGNIAGNQVLRGSFNINVNLSAGLHTFSFQSVRPFIINAGTPFQFYDNIHINAINEVPVPPGLVLGGIGIVGLSGMTWYRRRKV